MSGEMRIDPATGETGPIIKSVNFTINPVLKNHFLFVRSN